jgi:XTP/dITP diphosphohydrolase
MPLLILGTGNRKKGVEMADLLRSVGVELRTLADFAPVTPVAEDGETFAANACLKASGYARQLGQWVLADDSGLMVDVLNGAPGVLSARYSGEQGNDEANNRRLLGELRDEPPERRLARFVCRVALADPAGEIRAESEGYCRGQILYEPHGGAGFGYDPLFEIREYHQTFAELGPVAKGCMSHRARAIRRIIPTMMRLVDSEAWT